MRDINDLSRAILNAERSLEALYSIAKDYPAVFPILIEAACEAGEFTMWHTGGGCTCWGAMIGPYQVMVTGEESAEAPKLEQPFVVGVYLDEEEVALFRGNEWGGAVLEMSPTAPPWTYHGTKLAELEDDDGTQRASQHCLASVQLVKSEAYGEQ